jgi:hypothetical protein
VTKQQPRSFPKLKILSKNQGTPVQNAGTIGQILMSGKLSNFSNVKVSPQLKAKFFKAIKEEKQSLHKSSIANKKSQAEKLSKIIYHAKHESFVKCVEWNKTCDNEELIQRGVF